jgi:hypothetical protein
VDEPLSRPANFFHDQGNPLAYQGFGFPMWLKNRSWISCKLDFVV